MAISFRSLLSRHAASSRRRLVKDGTTKTLFENTDPGSYTLYFKDQISPAFRPAFNVLGKGAINNRLSELFMSRLNEMGIETHFIRRLNMSEQLVRSAEALPFRITVYNMAVDTLIDRLGLDETHMFPRPLIEFSQRSKNLNYPIVAAQHIESFEWAHPDEIDDIITIALRTNDFLNGHFFALGFRLLSFHLEFGRVYEGEMLEDSRLILIDEISPDNCAILDLQTGERFDGLHQDTLDKDDLSQRYQEVARRFGILEEGGPLDLRESIVIETKDEKDSTSHKIQETPQNGEGEK